jgi:hypothetical protein
MSSEPKGDPQALVQHIARALAEHPEQVEAVVVPEGREIAVELTVAESDLGRIIGRGGRTAKAFRQVLRASGDANGKRYELEILE